MARGPEAEPFRHKLDALGFGFLIPTLFIVNGTQMDAAALVGAGILSVLIFPLIALALRARQSRTAATPSAPGDA